MFVVQSEAHYSTLWADDLSCPDAHLGAADADADADADVDADGGVLGGAGTVSSAAFAGILASAGPIGADGRSAGCSGGGGALELCPRDPRERLSRGVVVQVRRSISSTSTRWPSATCRYVLGLGLRRTSALGVPRPSASRGRVGLGVVRTEPLRDPSQVRLTLRRRGADAESAAGGDAGGRVAAAPPAAAPPAAAPPAAAPPPPPWHECAPRPIAPSYCPLARATAFLCACVGDQVLAPRECIAHALARRPRRLERPRSHPLSAPHDRSCNPLISRAPPASDGRGSSHDA